MTDNFSISASASVKEALAKIEKNTLGIVFIEEQNKVVGALTDGDVRRGLLDGQTLESPAKRFANKEFVKLNEDEKNTENILKLIDNKIKVIPILNANGELVEVVSHKDISTLKHAKLISKSRSPMRISFGGGGTDLTSYFYENTGVVLNSTIAKFAYATLIKREDKKINILSQDLGESVSLESLEAITYDGKLDLIKAIIKTIQPEFGFDLYTFSEAPKGSGLGGSAVVLSAVIGAFNNFREMVFDRYEIAELAFQAERIELGMPGGWQDQYATVFGGFNFMEFDSKENVVHPLRISEETLLELEDSLILCYTGKTHAIGQVHHDQKKEMDKTDVKTYAAYSKELAFKMKSRLLKNELDDFGILLDQAWQTKKKFSSKISNDYLDDIYNFAIKSGALGGKLLGAGGGGYFLFYLPTSKKRACIQALESKGYDTEPVRFDQKGLVNWISRAYIK